MRFHIERQTEDLARAGVSRTEAERQARLEFGTFMSAKEECRTVCGFQWVVELLGDMRHTARSFRKSPLFVVVSISVLACGIGACTAMFSVLNSVVLKPLPYPQADRIVRISSNNSILHVSDGPTSYPDAQDWGASGLFKTVGIYWADTEVVTIHGHSEPVLTGVATRGFFSVLGVRPVYGRLFTSAEDTPSEAPVVLVTERFWRRRLGGDKGAIGGTLRINGKSAPVVGIIPAVLGLGRDPELWVAPTAGNATARANRYWSAVARLRDDLNRVQTQERLRQICARLAAAFPDSNREWGVDLINLQDSVVGNFRTQLLVLFGSVLFVLLVVCANVASLSLVRATARARELAIRSSLGASRWRLARQLLAESGTIAFLGAAAGSVLAWGAVQMLRTRGPSDLPRLEEIAMDVRSLAFAAGLAVLTGVISGIAPILQTAKAGERRAMEEAGRLSTDTRRRSRVRSSFVIAEVALSVVLLSGAGLLIKTFNAMAHEDLGFRPDHLLTGFLEMPSTKYMDGGKYQEDKVRRYADEMITALRSLPGVEKAATGMYVPVSGGGYETWQKFWVEGDTGPQARFVHGINQTVTLDYFKTLGIPLRSGRLFTTSDTANAPQVVIINEAFARQRFGADRTLDHRILLENDKTPRQIVGVVGNTQPNMPSESKPPQLYVPMAQQPVPVFAVFLRTRETPQVLKASLERHVLAVDPDIPIFRVRTQEEVIARALSGKRFLTGLMCGFAGAAILLAIIGLYGVIAYAVAQRTREFGVRLALGAQPAALVAGVVGHGSRLLVIGVGIGIAAALALTRVLGALLYHVNPRDAAVFSIVSAVVFTAGIVSCWLPARRVEEIDPATALRWE
jgi:predicted permease